MCFYKRTDTQELFHRPGGSCPSSSQGTGPPHCGAGMKPAYSSGGSEWGGFAVGPPASTVCWQDRPSHHTPCGPVKPVGRPACGHTDLPLFSPC